MPFDINWYDADKTIILMKFSAYWRWEEYYVAFTDIIKPMIASVDHTVHLIPDLLESKQKPLDGVHHAYTVLSNMPPNLGEVIVVSHNGFIAMLVRVFQRMKFTDLSTHMHHTTTITEALSIINAARPEQPIRH